MRSFSAFQLAASNRQISIPHTSSAALGEWASNENYRLLSRECYRVLLAMKMKGAHNLIVINFAY